MFTRHPPRKRVASLSWLATVALSLLLPLSAPTRAGSLQVAPILLEFANGQNSQTLWLANTGEYPLRAQIRVQQWTQVDMQEVLQPSDALLASPPLIDIAAGHSQLVRLVQAAPAHPTHESAFRLIVDELPGGADTVASGLQFLLRYSIPVFVLPLGAIPQLERTGAITPTNAQLLQGDWNVEGGNATLTLQNHSEQRIRISQLNWVTPSGTSVEISAGLLGYVLAGSQVRWTLPLRAALPANGILQAKLNDDANPQPLPQLTHGQ